MSSNRELSRWVRDRAGLKEWHPQEGAHTDWFLPEPNEPTVLLRALAVFQQALALPKDILRGRSLLLQIVFAEAFACPSDLDSSAELSKSGVLEVKSENLSFPPLLYVVDGDQLKWWHEQFASWPKPHLDKILADGQPSDVSRFDSCHQNDSKEESGYMGLVLAEWGSGQYTP